MNEKKVKNIVERIMDELGPYEFKDSEKVAGHQFEECYSPMAVCISTELLDELATEIGIKQKQSVNTGVKRRIIRKGGGIQRKPLRSTHKR